MRYNRYLYRLSVQAVPITDIVKNSISSADIVTDPIIGTSLYSVYTVYTLYDYHTVYIQCIHYMITIQCIYSVYII